MTNWLLASRAHVLIHLQVSSTFMHEKLLNGSAKIFMADEQCEASTPSFRWLQGKAIHQGADE